MLDCIDTGGLVHAYVDRELPLDDRAELEEHMASCAACRQQVGHELAFVASVRARLVAPNADPELGARISRSLACSASRSSADPHRAEDRRAPIGALAAPAMLAGSHRLTRSPRRLWLGAVTAGLALALGFGALATWQGDRELAERVGEGPSSASSSVSSSASSSASGRLELIPMHLDQPVELSLERPEHLSYQIRDLVGLWAPVPRLQAGQAELRRARVVRFPDGRRAAQIDYFLAVADPAPQASPSRGLSVALYAFDPAGVELPSERVIRIAGTDVHVRSARGIARAYYVKDGIGFALLANMSADRLIALVSGELGLAQASVEPAISRQ